MSDLRKAAEMALEALEEIYRTGDTQAFDLCYAPNVIPALRQAIAEAEKQEPVGWLDSEGRFSYFKHLDSDEPLYTAPVHASDMSEKHVHESDKHRHEKGTSQENRHIAMRKTTRDEKIVNPGVYEVPEFECPRCGHCCPEREWVGLTDDEFQACFDHADGTLGSLMYAIEAKLKEKNT